MKIAKSVKGIYDYEVPIMVENLRKLNREERHELYMNLTKNLFPKSKKSVELECLLSPRNDYKHKFKKCFLWVTNRMLSDYHFGEYYQNYFSEKTDTSYRFPQKVIMSLSLLGYIDGLKTKYSNNQDKEWSHGYIYSMNYNKMDEYWSNTDVSTTIPFIEENPLNESFTLPDEYQTCIYKKWLVDKQYKTIMSIEVSNGLKFEKQTNDRFIRNYNLERQSYFENNLYEEPVVDYEVVECDGDEDDIEEDDVIDTPIDHEKKQEKIVKYQLYNEYKYRAINITNFMEKDPEVMEKFSIDNYSGRLHSLMTRTRNDIRLSGGLTINGEKLCEVDISSSQPTLFGLLVKSTYPDLKSCWLEQCLVGNFYEWLIDITGMATFDKERVIESISWKHQARLCSKMDNDDPHIYMRPVVKFWIMRFMFGAFSIKSLEKNSGSPYKTFTSNLCKYLKTNEPLLYNEFAAYRRGAIDKKSLLPKRLQAFEVEFIKECLKRIDAEVEYLYTIHDCIGCIEPDSEKVKCIMEQTSMDMFGVKANFKIEKCH